MGLAHSPRIVTDGLVLALDAANTKSVPRNNILSTWTDYGGNQTNYEILGDYSIKLKNTSTGWVGYFPATVSSTGKYIITFTYYADSNGSSLVLDNDGIMDNAYNTTVTANITPQTYTGSYDVTTTGGIKHYFRRSSGGNIFVTDVSYFKLETTWGDLSGNGNNGTLTNGPTYSSANGGSIVFDGTNDYVTLPNFTYTPYCLDFWVYNNTQITANNGSVGGPSTYQTLFRNLSGLQLNLGGWTSVMTNETLHIYSGGKYTYINQTIPVGYHNWVYNWNGSNYDIWVDGVKKTAIAGSTGHATLAQQSSSNYVGHNAGSYYFYGNIYGMKIYTSQLLDAQVQQNFNALRGRYGI